MKLYVANSNPRIAESAVLGKVEKELAKTLNSKTFVSDKDLDKVFRSLEDRHYERNEDASFEYPIYEITVKKIGDYEISSQFYLELDTEFISL